MDSPFPFWLLLSVSFALLLCQGLQKNKTLSHYLFGLFCFSLCMMCIQKLSAEHLGPYQYLVGFATCATCNVMWLLSRSLFRKHDAVRKRHIGVALVIALMIVLNQAWHLVSELNVQHTLVQTSMRQLKVALNESTNLLSSCILILSFWEPLRGYRSKTRNEKIHSIIFALAYFAAVFNSTIILKLLFNPEQYAMAEPWFVASSALIILIAVQSILMLKRKHEKLQFTVNKALDSGNEFVSCESLIKGIKALMIDEKIYLNESIKIVDFAKRLEEPEYKISKTIRQHFKVANFNQFLNQYRVDHAKDLLSRGDTDAWPILVVGIESGFASAISFNRVFKANTGMLPKQYRDHSRAAASSVHDSGFASDIL